jgi:hypothetical protein
MNPKEWMDYMFDHTYIIAEDDPFLKKLWIWISLE